jgi:hypothetical protein
MTEVKSLTARSDDDKNGATGTVYFTDSNTGLTSKEFVNTTDGLVYKDGYVSVPFSTL